MDLPEEEKEILKMGVGNLQGELHLLYTLTLAARTKAMKLYDFVQIQQRLPAPGDLQNILDDMVHALDSLTDKTIVLQDELVKPRQIVNDLAKGVYD
jgi:hypothetical protein